MIIALCRFQCGLVDMERDNPNDPKGGSFESSDINVKQAGAGIPDGGSFIFGSVLINTQKELEFVIENLGSGGLLLTGNPRVEITGTHASSFQVTIDPASSVNGGGFTTFKINFLGSATACTRTAMVTIESDDPDESSYTFSISCTVTTTPQPEINVAAGSNIPNGGSKDFGTTKLKITVEVVFTIQNTGTANLNLTGSPHVNITGTDAARYTVLAQPASPVTPGGNVTFTIRFTPTEMGIASATVTIANNDSDEGSYSFTITGTGVFPIADTGQTNCYDSAGNVITCNEDPAGYPRQDGLWTNKPNARSYTGPTQHPTYTTNYTTKDNVTGLVWKSCSEGLSDSNCGTGTVWSLSWDNAQNACANLNTLNGGAGYAGRTTWRLPSIYELKAIVNYGIYNPAIETVRFPSTLWDNYWSSSQGAVLPSYAWCIVFNYGELYNHTKSLNKYVRCVADGP